MTREELIKKISAEIAKLSDNASQMCEEYEGYRLACKDISDVLREIAKESQPPLPSNLDEAAIDAAQLDMQDRQIMEATNDEILRYSRIFRRGFKAGAEYEAEQGVSMEITDETEWVDVDNFVHRNCDGVTVIQIKKKEE